MALDRMLDSISFPPPFALLISFMLPFTLPVPFGFLFFLTFTPVTLYSTAAELTIYRSSIFPSFLCWALIKNKERKKKREPRRYYSSRRTSFDTFQVPRRA
jgi:hypothetical protein